MSLIIGISAYYHDSACCLLKDGEILSAVQEERFSRIKNDSVFPNLSLKWILKNNQIKIDDIDAFVFYEKPFLKFERIIESYTALAPFSYKSYLKFIPDWITNKIFLKNQIVKELKKLKDNYNFNDKVFFGEHHMSHASSAFYPSPFIDATILTLDGVGEWSTTTIAEGNKNKIHIKESIEYPHSLGLLYSAFTYYLGFKVNEDEYKVMGLAPFGKSLYHEKILEKIITVKSDGSFKMNMKYFNYTTGFTMTNKNFSNLFGHNVRKKKEEINQFHMDLAASIQKVIEMILMKICTYIKENYSSENLCLAGGVALNCVANGIIKKNNIFKNIWIQPAAGDAGGALGCAYGFYYQHLNNKRNINLPDSMKSSYLGPNYSNEEVEKFYRESSIEYIKYDDDLLFKFISQELQKGKIIAWCQGNLEFGPRALGNRSILADPRDISMQKKLNLKIKFREGFRPFAPIVLLDHVSNWFELSSESPYMLLVAKVKKNILSNQNKNEYKNLESINNIRSSIPSVTHVDDTARVQTIDKKNGKIFNLLSVFYEETHCPVLVNTSFNLSGEPIVNTPKEAYSSFMISDIDILCFENTVVVK